MSEVKVFESVKRYGLLFVIVMSIGEKVIVYMTTSR